MTIASGGLVNALDDAAWYYAVGAGVVMIFVACLLIYLANKADQKGDGCSGCLIGVLAIIFGLFGFTALLMGLFGT